MAYDYTDHNRKLEHGECEECDRIAFSDELKNLINRHSMENVSGTPDFILAKYLESCLEAFETATNERNGWGPE